MNFSTRNIKQGGKHNCRTLEDCYAFELLETQFKQSSPCIENAGGLGVVKIDSTSDPETKK
jgi:hypothetical protein